MPVRNILASSSDDGTLKWWWLATPRRLIKEAFHSSSITSVAFSPFGDRFAFGSSDNTIRLFGTRPLSYITSLEGHSDSVTSIRFSSNGLRLASSSDDGTVRLWDVPLQRYITAVEQHLPPRSEVSEESEVSLEVGFSAKSEANPEFKLEGGYEGGAGASRRRDSVVRSEEESMLSLDTSSGCSIMELYTQSLAFSPHGSLVSSTPGRAIRLWDRQAEKPLRKLQGQSQSISLVTFSSEGSTLACGLDDGTITLWNILSGTPDIPTPQGHLAPIISMAFSADGTRLASVDSDGEPRMWGLKSGKHLILGVHIEAAAIIFSHRATLGECVLSGSLGGTVKWWSVNGNQTGHCIKTTTFGTGSTTSFASSSDGRKIACKDLLGRLQLWDAYSGLYMRTFELTLHSVIGPIVFSPDGSWLAAGSDNRGTPQGTIGLWDVQSGSLVEKRPPQTPDDKKVAPDTQARKL
ncbi:hypothetical protein FRB94_001891 [Tulasnella sp. JGI-2019a]|nr:hypothetical protein FRB93_004056 [Tulasnella sp. JGI-2019a]KAG9005001.1 hypothetical protein FRB94_001891 [Tulasnella sp. JGI-2019a]KAG9031950.1 hypothetical protein FRB95_002086 [Tulasnella sp. JGI-2019a]